PHHLFAEHPGQERFTGVKPKPRSGFIDILRKNFVPTCSAVLRKDAILPLPEWYDGFIYGDWPLYILAATHGALVYLDEVMGTYRVHSGGYWSSGRSTYRRIADVEEVEMAFEVLNRHFNQRFEGQINEEVSREYQVGST